MTPGKEPRPTCNSRGELCWQPTDDAPCAKCGDPEPMFSSSGGTLVHMPEEGE